MLESKLERVARNAIGLGIQPAWLIDNAGAAVARAVVQQRQAASGYSASVAVLAGEGFVGGTGVAAARHLSSMGCQVTLVHMAPSTLADGTFSQAYQSQASVVQNLCHSLKYVPLSDSAQLLRWLSDLSLHFDVIVPALDSASWVVNDPKVRGQLIKLVDAVDSLVICVGDSRGECMHTLQSLPPRSTLHTIITFHRLGEISQGHEDETLVFDLGIPWEAEFVLGPGDLDRQTFLRPNTAQKGDYGQALVIAGSRGRGPAPVLAGLAALRTGVDGVTLFVPESVAPSVSSLGAVLYHYHVTGEYISSEHISDLCSRLDRARLETPALRCVLLGPGMGKRPEVLEAIPKLVEAVQDAGFSIVLDGDALKANILPVCRSTTPVIITPNKREFKKMFHIEPASMIEELVYQVQEAAGRHNLVIVLKGACDIIADGAEYRLNRTGNPAMAVVGTGDVLSGMIAGLLAQGFPPFQAACMASYWIGKAGDLAFQEQGYGLLAMDVIEHLTVAL